MLNKGPQQHQQSEPPQKSDSPLAALADMAALQPPSLGSQSEGSLLVEDQFLAVHIIQAVRKMNTENDSYAKIETNAWKHPQKSQSLADDFIAKHGKITPELLNFIISDGEYQDQSVALALSEGAAGHHVLLKSDLLRYVTAKTLNHQLTAPEWKGVSMAFWLAWDEAGLSLLWNKNDKKNSLITKLSEETINTIIEANPDQGADPIAVAMYQKASIALFLATAQCDALAAKDTNHIISPLALNTIATSGRYKGTTPAYWLLSNTQGRQYVLNNPHTILANINKDVLNSQTVKGKNLSPSGKTVEQFLHTVKNGGCLVECIKDPQQVDVYWPNQQPQVLSAFKSIADQSSGGSVDSIDMDDSDSEDDRPLASQVKSDSAIATKRKYSELSIDTSTSPDSSSSSSSSFSSSSGSSSGSSSSSSSSSSSLSLSDDFERDQLQAALEAENASLFRKVRELNCKLQQQVEANQILVQTIQEHLQLSNIRYDILQQVVDKYTESIPLSSSHSSSMDDSSSPAKKAKKR